MRDSYIIGTYFADKMLERASHIMPILARIRALITNPLFLCIMAQVLVLYVRKPVHEAMEGKYNNFFKRCIHAADEFKITMSTYEHALGFDILDGF